MCFHWKSLQRQVRISGSVNQVDDKEADLYFNSRHYESRIGAWASDQSKKMNDRNLLSNISRKGRSNIEVNFSNEFAANEHEDFYKRVTSLDY